MRLFILAVCIFLILPEAHSQSSRVDSLNILIGKARTDTDRIKLMFEKVHAFKNINIDSAIELSKRVLVEVKKINNYGGQINIRKLLAESYSTKGDFKNAAKELNYLLKFIKPSKDSTQLARVYSDFGMMYGIQSKYDSSIFYYLKAIGISERHDDSRELTNYYLNVAISYQQISNFPKAIFYYHNALKKAEAKNDKRNIAYIHVNMAQTYTSMNDTARAEESYLKALEIAKSEDILPVIIYSYSNLSSLYTKQGKWQKSYDLGMKAAKLGHKMGDQGIESASLAKAALSLANMNKFTEATTLGMKAIKIADSSGQSLNIFSTNSIMGNIYRIQGKYKTAIPFYEKCLSNFDQSDLYVIQNISFYQQLSECYQKTGNYPKALVAYKQSAVIADSVRSKENIRKATELNMNFEFAKKQERLKAEQHAENEIAHTQKMALLAGLGLFLLLALVAFRGYRNKQHANVILNKKNEEVQRTLTELKSTQKQLIQSEKMASLGELTAGIAHEIQNPLNFVNNFSEVSNELIDEMKEELSKKNYEDANAIADDLKQNLEKINHHGKRAGDIVKGMLQHSRSSTGVKEPTNINALADEYLRLAYHGLRAKDKSFNASTKTDFDESIGTVNIIPQDIGRVILNLITNAFYAVNEKSNSEIDGYEPTVSVSTKKQNNHVLISVRDNGNGIPKKVIDKIFQPFFTTKPTGQGTGLGLSLSYDIVQAHGGELQVETFYNDKEMKEESIGKKGFTEFTISLPC